MMVLGVVCLVKWLALPFFFLSGFGDIFNKRSFFVCSKEKWRQATTEDEEGVVGWKGKEREKAKRRDWCEEAANIVLHTIHSNACVIY